MAGMQIAFFSARIASFSGQTTKFDFEVSVSGDECAFLFIWHFGNQDINFDV